MAKRSDLFDPTDPDRLPVQRQTEVAAVLAAGVIRMREKRRAPPASRASRGRCRFSGARTATRSRLNYWGQCNVPAPNAGFVAVSGGLGHSLGLKGGTLGDLNCDDAAAPSSFGV